MEYPVSDAGAFLQAGKFSDGDAGQGVPASIDKAAHMNAVYDEIINAIAALGETPTENVNDQLKTGIESLITLINTPFLPDLAEVGSYAFLYVLNDEIIPGNIYSGGFLKYSSVVLYNGQTNLGADSTRIIPGSWKAMGFIPDPVNYAFLGATLFLRVL